MFHGTFTAARGRFSNPVAAGRRRARSAHSWRWRLSLNGCAYGSPLLLTVELRYLLFLLIGDPIWLIAAANFTYLIGICLPSVAVWLLRRDAP